MRRPLKRAKIPSLFLVLICLQSTQSYSRAHHATATEFDISKTVKLKGVVSKLDWANPHAHLNLDVKTGDTEEHWDVELASPGGIVVSGLSKDVLAPGTTLTITGYPGKANRLSICATQVQLTDGKIATFVVGI